jgi:hypothetical protein
LTDESEDEVPNVVWAEPGMPAVSAQARRMRTGRGHLPGLFGLSAKLMPILFSIADCAERHLTIYRNGSWMEKRPQIR